MPGLAGILKILSSLRVILPALAELIVYTKKWLRKKKLKGAIDEAKKGDTSSLENHLRNPTDLSPDELSDSKEDPTLYRR